jgi:nitroreductase/NAD-dependent dihydropyrimidine dehydrogenase PreA subunit
MFPFGDQLSHREKDLEACMPVKHSLYQNAGQVSVDQDQCHRCGLCVRICPAEVLTLEAGSVQQLSTGFDCIGCGHCMMVCPQDCLSVSGRDLSHADLRPLPEPDQRADAAALWALMQSRRSVRRFAERPVEAELLEQIVDAAASAPMGIPPWDVGVATVSGVPEVQKLAAEIIAGYQGLLKVIRPQLLSLLRPFIGRLRYEKFSGFIRPLAEGYVESHQQGRDTLFWNAPAVLIFHLSAYADAADATIACTYAMLVAESLGLGSCMIGGAPPVIQRNRELCRKLKIPEGNTPTIALIVGYPAVSFKRTIKRRFSHQQ